MAGLRICLLLAIALFIRSEPLNAQDARQEHIARIEASFHAATLETRTLWRDGDVERYAEGLVVTLESFKDRLLPQDYELIYNFLPDLADEMARTVITGGPVHSLFIDAFLADFKGRLEGLTGHEFPIFPDEETVNKIRERIAQVIDQFFDQVRLPAEVTAEMAENARQNAFERCIHYADHPLRAELKNPLTDDEYNELLELVLSNADDINFDDPRYDRPNITLQRKLTSEIQTTLIRPILGYWHRTPLLVTSAEASDLYRKASDAMFGTIGGETGISEFYLH